VTLKEAVGCVAVGFARLSFPSRGNVVGVGQNTFAYHSDTGHIYVES